MANLKILTENEAGDGWIDYNPSSPVTGYQAQNTNITASRLGFDICSISMDADNIIIDGKSGVIDVNGVPFVMIEDKKFAKSGFNEGAYWFKLVAVSSTELNIEKTTVSPTWNPTKQYYESSAGERVLSWKVVKDGSDFSTERIGAPELKTSSQFQVGIGIGEKREFPDVGGHSIVIRDDGIYMIYVISGGGGAYAPITGTGSKGYNGGGCVRVDLALKAGQKVQFNVGDKWTSSSCIISGRLEMYARAIGSDLGSLSSIISVIGTSQRESIYGGGLGGSVNISDFISPVWKVGGYGGGAGPNGHGQSGFGIHKEGTANTVIKMDACCQVGKAGLGGIGTGFAGIEYLGK